MTKQDKNFAWSRFSYRVNGPAIVTPTEQVDPHFEMRFAPHVWFVFAIHFSFAICWTVQLDNNVIQLLDNIRGGLRLGIFVVADLDFYRGGIEFCVVEDCELGNF